MDRSIAPGSSTLAPVLMIAGAVGVPIGRVMPRFSPRASLHPIGPAADTGWTSSVPRVGPHACDTMTPPPEPPAGPIRGDGPPTGS
jgi:hypothetical protein